MWNSRKRSKGLENYVQIGNGQTGANIDILGISKLKWTRMCEFNSDDRYIYYCGQESLRRNGVTVNKMHFCCSSLKCSTWMQYKKMKE